MTRICLKPWEVSALRRDGMGWGHDLDCGCLHVDGDVPRRPGLLGRLRAALRRREA